MFRWIKDKVLKIFEKDVTADIKERITNPFFLSLILSWAIWNWKLLYVFFSSNNQVVVNSVNGFVDFRYKQISDYLSNHGYCDNLLLYPILTAFVAILFFGILNLIALAISVFFRRQLRPIIYKYIGHKDIVDQNTHNELKNRLNDLQEEYLEIDKEYSRLTTEKNRIKKNYDSIKDNENKFKINATMANTALEEERLRHDLADLFTEIWRLDYITKHGDYGSEKVEIREGKKYICNDKYKFDLDMIEIDRDKGMMKFRKLQNSPNADRTLINELSMIDKNEFYGIESQYNIVIYTRQGSKVLEFEPRYESNKIKLGDNTSIVFKFRNLTNTSLEVLSYQFSCMHNCVPYGVQGQKQPISVQLDGGKEKVEKFGAVDPLVEYFQGNRDKGIFDSEIKIEFRVDGTTEIRTLTRFARLVVS